jgi:hypothetical protein
MKPELRAELISYLRTVRRTAEGLQHHLEQDLSALEPQEQVSCFEAARTNYIIAAAHLAGAIQETYQRKGE